MWWTTTQLIFLGIETLKIYFEPHQRIRYVFYNLLQKLLFPIGHDFLTEGGYKPTSNTYFMYCVNALSFASCIYTCIWYDISTGLNSLSYGAVNIQVKQSSKFTNTFATTCPSSKFEVFCFVAADGQNVINAICAADHHCF